MCNKQLNTMLKFIAIYNYVIEEISHIDANIQMRNLTDEV